MEKMLCQAIVNITKQKLGTIYYNLVKLKRVVIYLTIKFLYLLTSSNIVLKIGFSDDFLVKLGNDFNATSKLIIIHSQHIFSFHLFQRSRTLNCHINNNKY